MNKGLTYKIVLFIFLLLLGWAGPVSALSEMEPDRLIAGNDVPPPDNLSLSAYCTQSDPRYTPYGDFTCVALVSGGSGEYTFEWDVDNATITYEFEVNYYTSRIIGDCESNEYFDVTVTVTDDITENFARRDLRYFCYS